MTNGEENILQIRAEQLQLQADRLTDFREKASFVTGPTMAVMGESWPLAIVQGAAGVTDFLDGYKAKQASALVGYDINPNGKDNDRNADKMLTYSGMAGTMIRDVLDGNYISGGYVGALVLTSAVRDSAIHNLRKRSSDKESSILLNRINTAARIGSLTIGMSPLGKTNIGRKVRNAGLGASVAIATYGYFQTKKRSRTV